MGWVNDASFGRCASVSAARATDGFRSRRDPKLLLCLTGQGLSPKYSSNSAETPGLILHDWDYKIVHGIIAIEDDNSIEKVQILIPWTISLLLDDDDDWKHTFIFILSKSTLSLMCTLSQARSYGFNRFVFAPFWVQYAIGGNHRGLHRELALFIIHYCDVLASFIILSCILWG